MENLIFLSLQKKDTLTYIIFPPKIQPTALRDQNLDFSINYNYPRVYRASYQDNYSNMYVISVELWLLTDPKEYGKRIPNPCFLELHVILEHNRTYGID